MAARDVETWSREWASQRLRAFACEWPGRDALLRLSDSMMGPDEDIDRAIAFLADRFERGHVVAVRLRDDTPVGARPNVLGAIDWDNIPMLSELSNAGDWVGGVDAPSGPAPSTAHVPTSEPLSPEPAADAELQPTLMRLELGALGFAEGCVLLLPRPGAGVWHPWAALTTVGKHLKENPGDRLVAVGHCERAEPEDHGRLRATALAHFVMGEREAWLAIAAKWGRVRDTQEYLAYLRHARGWPLPPVSITDEADAATASAVLAFQHAYNTRPECAAAIFEDGVIGQQTLGAIFDTARTELRQWLGLRRTDCDAFVWHDASRPSIDCAVGFKPYRTMPALPVQHCGRMVDLVIVPEQEAGKIDLGQGPSGVYDVAAIHTLALGAVVAPRKGMSIEIALRDASDAAIADAAYEVDVPGGLRVRGRLDANGEARLDDLVEGWCRVRFPELAGGCEIREIAALE